MERELMPVFKKYDEKYFNNKLKTVDIGWSDKMTLCTGKTYLKHRGQLRLSSIRLSKPLLSQRPYQDTINTLLHEMIHAYLFLTKGKGYGESHGEDFKSHMRRINNQEGSNIKICHNFLKEVNKFRIHIYQCNGSCRFQKPFFGRLRRAITRPPGPEDKWWSKHSQECGGTFIKMKNNDITERKTSQIIEPLYQNGIPSKAHSSGASTRNIPVVLKRVKANVNTSYVSKIRRINVGKYVKKYVDYQRSIKESKNYSDCRSEKESCTNLRRHLNSKVEAYICRMKNYAKS